MNAVSPLGFLSVGRSKLHVREEYFPPHERPRQVAKNRLIHELS